MNRPLSWDEYFMSIALVSTMRSKDPNTKVGACIIDKHKRIIGTGYNGMPKGNDEAFSWGRDGEFTDTKYAYVVHAELNAISNSTTDLHGATMYVSLFPCNECAKAIVQAGIKKVIYASDKYNGSSTNEASKYIFRATGVEFEQMEYPEQIILKMEEEV